MRSPPDDADSTQNWARVLEEIVQGIGRSWFAFAPLFQDARDSDWIHQLQIPVHKFFAEKHPDQCAEGKIRAER